jgi:hypothetical protein
VTVDERDGLWFVIEDGQSPDPSPRMPKRGAGWRSNDAKDERIAMMRRARSRTGHKRRNKINENFITRITRMLESPAFAVLSRGAHQFLARLEIEFSHHGGNDNGRLPLTYGDLVNYGMSRNQIPAALREAEALGFVECTKQGCGGNADSRHASLWRLTYVYGRDNRDIPPTHEWQQIKSLAEAHRIAREARDAKDPKAVAFGQRRKIKSRSMKLRPSPVLETNTGNATSPVLETGTTELGRKQVRLSISRVGAARAGSSSKRGRTASTLASKERNATTREKS